MSSKSPENTRILPNKLRYSVLNALNPAGAFLARLHFTPNMLTSLALVFGLGAGILFAINHPFWASIMIVFCGLFDILDGKVAAKAHNQSLFGAIFDSSLDRYSEFFIYLGLAIHFHKHWAIWIIFFTIIGSTMVSYTRARAEGLGIECKIGFMQRAERMVLLFTGAFVGALFNIFDPFIIGVLGIIAIVSNITAFQRIFYVRKVEKQLKFKKEVS